MSAQSLFGKCRPTKIAGKNADVVPMLKNSLILIPYCGIIKIRVVRLYPPYLSCVNTFGSGSCGGEPLFLLSWEARRRVALNIYAISQSHSLLSVPALMSRSWFPFGTSSAFALGFVSLDCDYIIH